MGRKRSRLLPREHSGLLRFARNDDGRHDSRGTIHPSIRATRHLAPTTRPIRRKLWDLGESILISG
jgi:hypothetical protein